MHKPTLTENCAQAQVNHCAGCSTSDICSNNERHLWLQPFFSLLSTHQPGGDKRSRSPFPSFCFGLSLLCGLIHLLLNERKLAQVHTTLRPESIVDSADDS